MWQKIEGDGLGTDRVFRGAVVSQLRFDEVWFEGLASKSTFVG
jgi:hypothetical protein